MCDRQTDEPTGQKRTVEKTFFSWFHLRILKFCYFHKLAHVDDYESYEGLLQRYLFVDPAMPYYHRNIGKPCWHE